VVGRRKDFRKKKDWDRAYAEISRQMSNFRNQELRKRFLEMYGNQCACPKCNETNSWFLTLDHVKNDGHIGRSQGKQNLCIYKKAVKQYRPDLYQVLCFNCNCSKDKNGELCPHFGINLSVFSRKTNSRKLSDRQVKEIRKRYKRWSRVNGIQALAREFEVCAEAIENAIRRDLNEVRNKRSVKTKLRRRKIKDKFLTMYGQVCNCLGCDESNKGFLTLDHVKNDGASESYDRAYRRAIEHYDPLTFQVLCYNCNCGKNRNKNVCPHIKIVKERFLKITGEKSKLDVETVRHIRKRHKQYDRNNGTRALAREFGVSVSTIEDIVYNRSWKNK
jgi:hypothetical protein